MTTDTLLAAFTRIRMAAEQHMDERDAADLGWAEESVTDIAIHKGLPQVQVVQFNRRQEGGGIGADYLWWWLDQESSECFGMLVQAKRLHHQSGHWTVDISHRNGQQLGDLVQTANNLQVPALYGIYTGGRQFRHDLPCFHEKQTNCLGCRRMAISLISAYQLWFSWESPRGTADMVFNYSIPLEDLADPSRPTGQVQDVNLPEIGSAELRRWLLQDQAGPREIAKRIFAPVARDRAGQFTAALATPVTIPSEPVFPDVPADPGHYPGSYFAHFLRGLRTSPPRYVRDLQEARPAPADIINRVAGVVLVTI